MLPRTRAACVWACACACILAGLAVGAGAFLSGRGGRVVFGVSLNGIPVGGLARKDASEIARAAARLVADRQLILTHGGREWVWRPEDVGVHCDPVVLVARLMGAGRGAASAGHPSVLGRIAGILRVCIRGVRVDALTSLDEARLSDAMISLANEVNVEMRNATFDVETGRPIPERPGTRLDVAASLLRVREALGALEGDARAELVVNEIKPLTTLADLSELGIKDLVASYSTVFDPGIVNRVHNIELACNRISGIMIRPGQEFSFNTVVGPRTREAGFLEAPEIVQEELRPGVGGGVCQVSSTLYNAALLGNFRITARQNHSRLTGYVPPGRDATVYYGAQDLCFRNTTPWPALILSVVSGSRLTVSIFGYKPPGQEVRMVVTALSYIEPRTVEVPDEDLAPGERVVEREGYRGCEVTVAREVVSNGAVVRRETVSRDRYKSGDRVVRVGVATPTRTISAGAQEESRPEP